MKLFLFTMKLIHVSSFFIMSTLEMRLEVSRRLKCVSYDGIGYLRILLNLER